MKLFFLTTLFLQTTVFATEYIAYFSQPIKELPEIRSGKITSKKTFGPNGQFLLIESNENFNTTQLAFTKIPNFKHLSPNNHISIPTEIPPSSNINGLWWQDAIQLSEAHEISEGSEDLVVAVIDTGVDYRHQDLKDSIFINSNEIPNNNIDDDQNGFVDDYYGYDFFSNLGGGMDDNGHGTHCAGIIAANGNFKGVAPKVKILPIKFLNNYGSGDILKAIEAINYAMIRGAKILTNSYGNPNNNQAFYEAVKIATNSGALFFAAAGNAKNDNDERGEYPANYSLKEVLSIGASNSSARKATFSNFGQLSVDLFAPGDNIYSLDLNNQYKIRSGTSMATPMAAGLAALIWSEHPQLNNQEIREILIKSSNQISSLYSYAQTPGVINALNGLKMIYPPSYFPIPRSKITSKEIVLESDSPYENNSRKTYELNLPNAKMISVHFNLIDVENAYDYLQIENTNGQILKKITGEFAAGDTQFFNQSKLIFRIVSDNTQVAKGFKIDRVNYVNDAGRK